MQPKQALRLCALGELIQNGPRLYADLADAVREFAAHLIAPTVDMMGTSLELLRYEGLIAPAVEGARAQAMPLTITEPGRAEFLALMRGDVAAPLSEITKLAVALKVRFLHLLPPDAQQDEVAALVRLYALELERLSELRADHAGSAGHLSAWLAHDIAQYERRLAWFRDLGDRLSAARP